MIHRYSYDRIWVRIEDGLKTHLAKLQQEVRANLDRVVRILSGLETLAPFQKAPLETQLNQIKDSLDDIYKEFKDLSDKILEQNALTKLRELANDTNITSSFAAIIKRLNDIVKISKYRSSRWSK